MRRRSTLVLATVAAVMAAADARAQLAALAGTYELVAKRAAAPGAPLDATGAEGERIVFDQGLQWLDGRSCEQWAAGPTRAAGAPSADDPALSDLQIPPVGEPGMFEDHRVNYTIEITCDGQPLARLLQVDERVLVLTAAGGAAYSIFERQLTEQEVRQLQTALNQAGYPAGPVDGVMGPSTRDAVAAYAAQRGADRRFETGVVTENLLEGIGFSATD